MLRSRGGGDASRTKCGSAGGRLCEGTVYRWRRRGAREEARHGAAPARSRSAGDDRGGTASGGDDDLDGLFLLGVKDQRQGGGRERRRRRPLVPGTSRFTACSGNIHLTRTGSICCGREMMGRRAWMGADGTTRPGPWQKWREWPVIDATPMHAALCFTRRDSPRRHRREGDPETALRVGSLPSLSPRPPFSATLCRSGPAECNFSLRGKTKGRAGSHGSCRSFTPPTPPLPLQPTQVVRGRWKKQPSVRRPT